MKSIERFSGFANMYEEGRPEYSIELIDKLYDSYGFLEVSIIADIGAGTGKFSKQLLDRGSKVFGVEPNDDMRSKAQKVLGTYGRFHSVKGTADLTSLKDKSIDLITCAQAFHWFNVSSFRRECERILKSDGRIVLIWNVRDMSSSINQECFEIYKKYCKNFVGFNGGICENDKRIQEFFHSEFERVEFDNPLYYEKDEFIKRCLSGSYSLTEKDDDFSGFVSLFKIVFDNYNIDGKIKMDNKSVAYIGTIKLS